MYKPNKKKNEWDWPSGGLQVCYIIASYTLLSVLRLNLYIYIHIYIFAVKNNVFTKCFYQHLLGIAFVITGV